MYDLGIIGYGIVGKSVGLAFENSPEVESIRTYDTNGECSHSFEAVCELSDIIFVSVPTPTEEFEQSNDILFDVIEHISSVISNKTVIIKSTILPGTTRMLSDTYPNLNYIFSPEFLVEKTYEKDSINPSRIIIGGENNTIIDPIYKLHRSTFLSPMYVCGWEEAELVKYVSNSFLAMKVIFSNIMFNTCESIDADWNIVREMWLADDRVGGSHTTVPGFNGKYGYGGKCFPKDVKAFASWMEENGNNPSLLKLIDHINTTLRQKETIKA